MPQQWQCQPNIPFYMELSVLFMTASSDIRNALNGIRIYVRFVTADGGTYNFYVDDILLLLYMIVLI